MRVGTRAGLDSKAFGLGFVSSLQHHPVMERCTGGMRNDVRLLASRRASHVRQNGKVCALGSHCPYARPLVPEGHCIAQVCGIALVGEAAYVALTLDLTCRLVEGFSHVGFAADVL